MAKTNYNCSQKDLYSVSRTGWENYGKYLVNFSSFKPKYKIATATDALAEIDIAEAIPDEAGRFELKETLRVELIKNGSTSCGNFQKLKAYIDDAFAVDLRKIKYKAAGQEHYAEAAGEDWESVTNLNVDMITFISNNEVALELNENMPTTFKAAVESDAAIFKKTYKDYKDAEQTEVATDEKIQANNNCYTTLTGMFRDGQLIFKDKPQYGMFVFTTLLDMINSTQASFDGKVTEVDFSAIGDVTITLSKVGTPPVVINSEADGSFDFGTVAAGNYTVKLVKTGYKDITENITVVVGTRLRKNFVMERV